MMATLFDPRPAVIGHRGFGRGSVEVGDRTVVENTLESYAAAAAAGLSWVEVDAQRTADDVLVVRHDPTTPDGEFLIEQTAARLGEQGIASLEEVLAALPPTVGVNVDVKTVIEDAVDETARRTGPLLAPILAAEARRRPLFVSSFDPSLLLYLKERLPDIPLGLIAWVNFPLRHAVAAAANLGFQAVCLHTGSFGLNRIEGGPVHRPLDHSVAVAHRAGLQVVAWCPRPEEVTGYVAAGIDAMVVNDIPGTFVALDGGDPSAAAPATPPAAEAGAESTPEGGAGTTERETGTTVREAGAESTPERGADTTERETGIAAAPPPAEPAASQAPAGESVVE